MKPFLRQQLAKYKDRQGELEFLLSREDIMKDMEQFLKLSREHTDVAAVAADPLAAVKRDGMIAYNAVCALCHDSSDGVAEPSTMAQPSKAARSTATSRPW